MLSPAKPHVRALSLGPPLLPKSRESSPTGEREGARKRAAKSAGIALSWSSSPDDWRGRSQPLGRHRQTMASTTSQGCPRPEATRTTPSTSSPLHLRAGGRPPRAVPRHHRLHHRRRHERTSPRPLSIANGVQHAHKVPRANERAYDHPTAVIADESMADGPRIASIGDGPPPQRAISSPAPRGLDNLESPSPSNTERTPP